MARITQWSGRNVSLLTDELCENIFQQADDVLGSEQMLSHFVKDSKNGNLVGIQEIPFWTIHSKGHGALVFLPPNKYTTAVG
jgi:hypothetical protein